MIKYDVVRKRPEQFLLIFGVSIQLFEEILEKLSPLWAKDILGNYKRQGGFPKLDITHMLLVLLLYYRNYITQEFVGMLFGLNKSNVCRIIKRLEPLLAKIMKLPERDKIPPDELESIIIDATENPIERPRYNQKLYYFGKKKTHTVKTEIRITKEMRITHVSETVPGTIHDIELLRKGTKLSKGTRVYADSGYQGIQHDHEESEYPYKKPKNGNLTAEEKEYNTALFKFRVRVENVLGQIKVFRILQQRYRNKRIKFNIKFRIVAGVVNLKNGFGFA
ncbi:MAG: transposase family protein [Holosporales bacterium]|jgi:hypothetical protein|nr:transposase family protein [Holosporales bacterium]